MALANVPEDVKPRTRALRCGTQLFATDILARLGPVEHEMGRAVGDQDIDVCRNEVPPLAQLCAALAVEGHVKEPWLPGRAPEGHSLDLDAAVQEIVTTGEYLGTQAWICLQTSVMVSGDHHLVRVRQAAEELSERSRFGSLALAAKVARMDQHVTVGDADLPVQAVGVAEKNQTQGQVSARGSVGSRIDRAYTLVNLTWVASRRSGQEAEERRKAEERKRNALAEAEAAQAALAGAIPGSYILEYAAGHPHISVRGDRTWHRKHPERAIARGSA